MGKLKSFTFYSITFLRAFLILFKERFFLLQYQRQTRHTITHALSVWFYGRVCFVSDLAYPRTEPSYHIFFSCSLEWSFYFPMCFHDSRLIENMLWMKYVSKVRDFFFFNIFFSDSKRTIRSKTKKKEILRIVNLEKWMKILRESCFTHYFKCLN